MPPDDTVSMPPLETVTLLVVVPATFRSPPLDTTMLAALPPLEMVRSPPDDTVAKVSLPPESTSTVAARKGGVGNARTADHTARRNRLDAAGKYRDTTGDLAVNISTPPLNKVRRGRHVQRSPAESNAHSNLPPDSTFTMPETRVPELA